MFRCSWPSTTPTRCGARRSSRRPIELLPTLQSSPSSSTLGDHWEFFRLVALSLPHFFSISHEVILQHLITFLWWAIAWDVSFSLSTSFPFTYFMSHFSVYFRKLICGKWSNGAVLLVADKKEVRFLEEFTFREYLNSKKSTQNAMFHCCFICRSRFIVRIDLTGFHCLQGWLHGRLMRFSITHRLFFCKWWSRFLYFLVF